MFYQGSPMSSEIPTLEAIIDSQKQKQKPQLENASKSSFMKAVLIKKGEYTLSNSFVLPSFDICLLGEQGTILVPAPNVLPILGVGNKDIRCSKCGYILIMRIKRPQIQDIAIKCPSCGSVSQL
jgi:hypothetical protein